MLRFGGWGGGWRASSSKLESLDNSIPTKKNKYLLHCDGLQFISTHLPALNIYTVSSSGVDPNTLNLDPDPGFWTNLDPDPGLYYQR